MTQHDSKAIDRENGRKTDQVAAGNPGRSIRERRDSAERQSTRSA